MKNEPMYECYSEMMRYAFYAARRDEIIADAWNMDIPPGRIAEIMGIGKATLYRTLRARGLYGGEDT